MATKERATDDKLLSTLETEEVWKGEAEASWFVDRGRKLRFPVSKISTSFGRRIQERERPGRRGARLTTTGPKARRYAVTIPLDGSIGGNFGMPLYPDLLEALLESFESDETGTLFLPMRGIKRCKVGDGMFDEDSESFQSATILTVPFIEDNEDVVTASTFSRASVRSQGRRLAAQSEFTLQKDGVWDGSLADMNELVSELEGIVALPTTTAQDITTRSRIVRHAAERAMRAFQTGGEEGARLLYDPLNSATVRQLVLVQDLAARAEEESLAGRRRTTSYLVEEDRSLQSIAVELRQSYEVLLELNQYGIEDPMALEDGDIVRVLEVGG